MTLKNTIAVRVANGNDVAVSYAKPGDGAFDLRSNLDEPTWLNPSCRVLVPTGIKLAIPEGYAGLVVPRSGLALKHGVTVTNAPGLIDSGYRGEIGVILENRGRQAFEIVPGERIAQMMIVPVYTAKFEFVTELDETVRGEGGFGSTGVA